ncbi:MAG: D-glycero-beta-D-manno-heptose-7-phosphate kinase, partial [Candidatus Saganbacteria bacterium]|nr:D-glycero-beta-D-manno-heptose-7-phosphate kinase [Candidatus Saganbacteria bacterium]
MEHLKTIIPQFEGKKILIIGDLMLDEHIWSTVSRISPEAPVPIAKVKNITHVPGGCGNVAANIKKLTGTPLLLGLIGKDSSGLKLTKALKSQKISTSYLIKLKDRPTILKSRIIAASQHVIRVDREEQGLISSSLEKDILNKIKNTIKEADAIILSDYKKGILSEKVCKEIINLARKHKKPLAVDPKGSDYSKYKRAMVITPNLLEAEAASGIKISNEESLNKAGKKLLNQTQADHIIITQGKEGLSVFSKSGETSHIPAIQREVFDITGAGDTVIATLSLSLASGASIKEAALLGNYAASVAVSKIGTQAVEKDELEEALEENDPTGKKIKSRSELTKIVKRLKSQGAEIVFTNGCFDILHLGHARYLR